MLARTFSSVINGLVAVPVEVQTQILPTRNDHEFKFEIIGLADTAIREARHRVVSALKVVGVRVPSHILVNLAPAGIKKDGSSFDLSIAVAVLKAMKKLDLPVRNCGYYGELALDGSVKPIVGMVAHAIAARKQGWKKLFVPEVNAQEVLQVTGLEIIPLKSVDDLFAYHRGDLLPITSSSHSPELAIEQPTFFLADVQGQEPAKRALVLSATGGHNLLFVGPPGCGKSMLAQRLPLLLSPMNSEERIESAGIHSIAGVPTSELLAGKRPFRSPHYTISDIGLIGGGHNPKPGEISLAHNGVLFLDELPEFKRLALEALRSPLESRKLLISRAKYNQEFPANFQLIAAMNPCPCGRLGSPRGDCSCGPQAVNKYLQKLSGPILDRIDLQVSLQAVDIQQFKQVSCSADCAKESELIQAIQQAQTRALERQGMCNSQLDNRTLIKMVHLKSKAEDFLENFATKRNFSARAYFRVLKVALTISDLKGNRGVEIEDIAEALSFRSLELIKDYARSC